MTSLNIFLFIFLHFTVIFAKISDKRLCRDPTCSEPVSRAKTLIRYSGDDHQILSFQSNEDVVIYSKSAGSRMDLWGAEIKGRRGYVPTKFVKEYKVFKDDKDLEYLIDTESATDGPVISTPTTQSNPQQEKTEANIVSSSVAEPYEVIDGTTVYLEPETTTVSDNERHITTEAKQEATKTIIPNTEKVLENLQQTQNAAQQNASNILTPDTLVGNLQEIQNVTKEADILIDNVNKTENIKKDQTTNEDISDDININKEPVPNFSEDTNKLTDFEFVNSAGNEMEEGEPIDTDADYGDEDIEVDEEEEEESQENVTDVNNNTSGPIEAESVEVISETIKIEERIATQSEFNNEAQSADIVTKQEQQQNVEISKNNSEDLVTNSEELLHHNTEEIQITLQQNVKPVENSNEKLSTVPSEPPIVYWPDSFQKELNSDPSQVPNSELRATNNDIVNIIETTTETSLLTDALPNSVKSEFLYAPSPDVQNVNVQSPEIVTESTFYKQVSDIPKTEEEILTDTFTDIPFIKQAPEDPKIDNIVTDKSKTPEFIDIPDLTSQQTTETFVNINTNELTDNVHKIEELNANFENPTLISVSDFATAVTETPTDESEPAVAPEVPNNLIEEGISQVNDDYSIFAKLYSLFGFNTEEETVKKNNEIVEEPITKKTHNMWGMHDQDIPANKYSSSNEIFTSSASDMQSCAASDNSNCETTADFVQREEEEDFSYFIFLQPYVNVLLYLSVTGITLLLFMLGYYYLEKRNNAGKLVNIICDLEKKLLRTSKEYQLAQEKISNAYGIAEINSQTDKLVDSLKEELEDIHSVKQALETQISILEAELEKSTEAGVELSSMLDEMVVQQGGEPVIQNLRRDLEIEEAKVLEVKEKLSEKMTENELLRTELSVVNEKCLQLQDDVDKMMVNVLAAQEEKQKLQEKLELQLKELKSTYEIANSQSSSEIRCVKEENMQLKNIVEETQRKLDIKSNEFDLLREGMNKVEESKTNKGSLMKLLEVSQVKAEVQQLREEKKKLAEKLKIEKDDNLVVQQEMQLAMQEVGILKSKSDEAEKEKVEAQTRLEVLSSYFKDKEAQLQKSLNENESKWLQREGEASTTFERIKWIQEELQNYKSQNELLKKEILDQEVSLKSQISMLEKKSHDNWMHARQAERRLDESKQEASQLRNRLTIVEKNFNNSTVNQLSEDKMQNRLLSPLETNGDLGISPLLMSNVENPGSPPLLYPHRDHLTTSPPIPGLPLPPFIPPPPGVPFMPPPLPGVPPFMPPPALFPGDHRPPPLGRMSSPPLRSRYSPDLRPYSPYDGDDSPPMSPGYPDSDYRRRSPAPHMPPPKNYSPYNGEKNRLPHQNWDHEDERDYRLQHRNKFRSHKGLSSGSGNSNESLENSGRHSGRI